MKYMKVQMEAMKKELGNKIGKENSKRMEDNSGKQMTELKKGLGNKIEEINQNSKNKIDFIYIVILLFINSNLKINRDHQK